MPQKTLIFALFAPPEMLRGGTLPFCPPLCTPLDLASTNAQTLVVLAFFCHFCLFCDNMHIITTLYPETTK